ncbi:F0F1 ATP synthase subunit delta [Candidatus Microgenomates bacterium]|nr:F0F1 ATP synthase subunit delta [Candidatus Microgenomates bacterium]
MSSNQAVSIANGFLNYLEKEGKKHLLGEVIEQLRMKNSSGSVSVVVQSAIELSAEQKKTLTIEVAKKFETDEIRFEINKELLGGFKIIAGDKVLDYSTKAKLDYISQNI